MKYKKIVREWLENVKQWLGNGIPVTTIGLPKPTNLIRNATPKATIGFPKPTNLIRNAIPKTKIELPKPINLIINCTTVATK